MDSGHSALRSSTRRHSRRPNWLRQLVAPEGSHQAGTTKPKKGPLPLQEATLFCFGGGAGIRTLGTL